MTLQASINAGQAPVSPGQAPSSRGLAPANRERPARPLHAVLGLLDAAVRAVEETAWGMRGLAAHAASVVDEARADAERMAEDAQALWQEVEDWPARATRLADTGWMLAQMAASYRWHETRSAFLSEAGAARALANTHAANARRFLDTSRRHGGAFLKVGQMLSSRPDLLPGVWVAELSSLQDAAPAIPFEPVRDSVEADLACSLDAAFARFEREPLASASIAQVHRAETADGREWAVKVQRPDIRDRIRRDMDLLALFLDAMHTSLPPADYETIVKEVRELIGAECDFVREARMMSRLADFFESIPGVHVPRPEPGLCGPKVLTSRFFRARKITRVLDDWAAQRDAGDAGAQERISTLLGRVLDAYLRQVLHAGVFQADPHPGNLLVTDDDELVILDFGCTRELADASRDRYLGLLQAFLVGDGSRVASLLHDLGFETRSGRPETLHAFADVLLSEFRSAAEGGGPLVWRAPEALLERAQQLLEQTRQDPVIRIPAEFVMLGRVFATLGGLFQHYRPDLDFARHIAPALQGAQPAA